MAMDYDQKIRRVQDEILKLGNRVDKLVKRVIALEEERDRMKVIIDNLNALIPKTTPTVETDDPQITSGD